MRRWHGLDGCPGEGVFALRELFQPFFVTAAAGICSHSPKLVDIESRTVATFVAIVATHVLGMVTADLPVDHDIACFFHVTVDAIIGNDHWTNEREDGHKQGGSQSG